MKGRILEVKENIIEKSDKLFHRYGIRSVSMDDIARELSISKKTIYQYFKDKDDLVLQVTRFHLNHEKDQFDGIAYVAMDPIDELVKISVCIRENFKEINPSLIYDLKKYHRVAWDEFMGFKSAFVRKNISDNLRKGIEQGVYREDINVDILSVFRMEQIEMPFNEALYPREEFKGEEVQMQLFNHFVQGIFTKKGKKLYKEYQEKLSSKPINEQ